nr:hypothetical protein [uncultured Cupriavidus sp.]
MNDTAIVYYSRTGTTRQAATLLGDRLDCPMFEVADQVSRAGVWGDIRCIIDNMFRRRAPYRYTGPALDKFTTVIVMAPVWVGHLAAPMRSFLRDHRPAGDGLAAVAVMAARGGFRAAEEIAGEIGRPPHPVLVLLQRDIVSGEVQQDIDDFASTLVRPAPDASGSPRSAWLSPNEA